MTTPPPDKQPAAETLEEIADDVARKWFPGDGSTVSATRLELRDDILSALRNERERAAKVAEAMRPTGGRMWTDEQSACFEALTECAKAIRKEGTNNGEM